MYIPRPMPFRSNAASRHVCCMAGIDIWNGVKKDLSPATATITPVVRQATEPSSRYRDNWVWNRRADFLQHNPGSPCDHGRQYTLIMNGCISAVVLVPCLVLLKGRTAVNVRVEPLQVKWFVHSTFFWVWTWGFFAAKAYFISIYSLAPYATDGIGLSQTQGAALQSILAGGQIIGRPLIGLALDKGGRFNMTIIANIVAGLSCVAIWMPARSFAALVPYAILQGVVGGTVFSVVVPVTTSAVGVLDMGSAFAMFGLSIVPATTFGQAIAVSLINFSKDTLLKSGGDVYQISIGLCGGFFWVSALLLFGGKVALQGNMKLLKKT
ncbi:unnamed protein product [Clonostachys rosea f. rosea IK726]|uniref:Uncharacterized protein n=1 Tax=Clonostachys rosea f. rosea IK726 TaxID=1349383 RepID=A0ACA9U7J0_BIOOC|nr:unnamed protein product [Clonostachys rosea f. rosea IK726]